MRNFIRVIRLRYLKINLLIFILISLFLTFIFEKVPDNIYHYKKWLFRERRWEKGGLFYEQYFKVKKWKTKLPDISDFVKRRFNKKHLAGLSRNYLLVFLEESCKSELTHWIIIISTLLFNFWSTVLAAFLMFLVACILNLPYIIIQRYNRPRVIRLMYSNNATGCRLSSAKTANQGL